VERPDTNTAAKPTSSITRPISSDPHDGEARHQHRLWKIAIVGTIAVAAISIIGAVIKEVVIPYVSSRDAGSELRWMVRVTPQVDGKHTHHFNSKSECVEMRDFLLERVASKGGVVRECTEVHNDSK